MRILHYALGFPPYRTGGLTKYCIDLMLEQLEQGNDVALLWPGKMQLCSKNTSIKKRKNWNGITSFELVNSVPVPLDEGIVDIDAYTKAVDESIYVKFLKQYKPDAIHIHSLMGLHKEFIQAANELGIYTVFTSHDYFGICPKVTLFHDGKVCDNDDGCSDCVQCNKTALSIKKIAVIQSPIYRRLKNTSIVVAIRKKHRQNFFDDASDSRNKAIDTGKAALEYRNLRQYYISMLEIIDFIHYNSSISKMIYEKYIHPKNSAVVPITHRGIKDNRQLKDFDHEVLRITYLGPAKPFKGFQFLLGILDHMWGEGIKKFELHLYSESKENRIYITHRQNGYLYSELEDIFKNTDLLIVPSQWYETFGFTVLEALSYGVPVLASENVGAKDLFDNRFGLVETDGWENTINSIILNRTILKEINQNIVNDFVFPKMDCAEKIYGSVNSYEKSED